MATPDEGFTLEELQAQGGKPHVDTPPPAADEGVDLGTLLKAGGVPHVDEPPSDPNSLDQKIRAGFQGATYGLGGKLVRNVESALPDDSILKQPLADTIDRALHPKEYMSPPPKAQNDEQVAKMYKDAVADNPGSNALGALMAPGPKALTKAKGVGGTLVNSAFQGGVAGAAAGAGNSEATTAQGVLKDAGEQGLIGAGAGAVLGPLLHGAGALAKGVGGKFNSVKEALLAKEAERLGKPMDDALKAQNTVKDRLKKQIYGEYVKSLAKSGTSPDEASKILQANDAQIQNGIEDEYRKALFGDYASKKKDLFTKIRNAEDLGAEWSPEQVEKTVGPAKTQYVQDAHATVDRGLPVPPEKMSPEELKAEVLRRGRAAQAKAVKSISTPPPNLDPALVDELAQKRLEAQQASGVVKKLPALYPAQSPDASLAAKGKDALGSLALKAGASGLAAGAGFKAGGPVGAAAGALGIPLASGALADWQNPGLQYLRAKAGAKLGDLGDKAVNGGLGVGELRAPDGLKGLIGPGASQLTPERAAKLRELMRLFGYSAAEGVE